MAAYVKIPTESITVSETDIEKWLKSLSQKLGGLPVMSNRSPCPVINEDLHLVVSWGTRQRADAITPYCHRHRCAASEIIQAFEELMKEDNHGC